MTQPGDYQRQLQVPVAGSSVPMRFFKTTAGPGATAYPAEASNISVYYAKMLRNVSFTETPGAQSLGYTETTTFRHIFNLAPEHYIEVDSVVLCFQLADGQWFTIDKVPAVSNYVYCVMEPPGSSGDKITYILDATDGSQITTVSDKPHAIRVGPSGNIWTAREVTSNTCKITKASSTGTEVWSTSTASMFGVPTVAVASSGKSLLGTRNSTSVGTGGIYAYDSSGTLDWTGDRGFASSDPQCAVSLSDGGWIVAGLSILKKFDEDGTEDFDKVSELAGASHPRSVVADSDGNFAVAQDRIIFSSGSKPRVKYFNSSGTLQWTKQGVADAEIVRDCLSLSTDGYLYWLVTDVVSPTSSSTDVVTLYKLDPSDGSEVWTKHFDGYTRGETGIPYEGGSCCTLGTDVFIGLHAPGSSITHQAQLLKLNSSGTVQWSADVALRTFTGMDITPGRVPAFA